MAPYPEEIDVFSLPHTRMKELVDVYREKLLYTDFKDYAALESLLQSLHHTFCEFKSHEQIENKYIMRKLKKRLKLLSIHDATVCNCHSDNKLSDMLALVKDGYSCTSKADRINFGIKLQDALQEFTGSFLPHMKEEEEVFQPMLMKYFGYDELKCLKDQVIKEHSKWHTYDILGKDKLCSKDPDSPFSQLPHEVVSHIMSFLPPNDLIHCSEVCRLWYNISRDPSLWREIYPCFWAHGIWENYDDNHEDRVEKFYPRLDGSDKQEDDFYDEAPDIQRSSSQEDLYDEHGSKEVKVIQGLINYLLPRVGLGVQKLVISSSRSLSNSLLKSLLILCPNVLHLDISYTTVSDSAFKGLKENSCCINMEHLNLSGCRNITDLGLFRFADCMAMLTPDVPDGSRHLREVYLRDCERFQGQNNGCFCEIEESGILLQRTNSCFKCASNDFCNSSCCWQKDGFMCHLAKLSLHCPYINSRGQFPQQSRHSFVSPGVSSIRKTTATLLTNSTKPVLHRKKREIQSLRYLNISGCNDITDDGLRCLFNAGVLKKLEYLDVSGCWLMTGEGLCSVTDFLTLLRPENLFYCDQIMDGPHPNTSNGCQNLETGMRACCRQIV